jgi:hypothetical protein
VVPVLGLAAGRSWWWRSPGVDPLRRGWAAYGRGDYQAAELEARGRLRNQRDDADALHLLARSLFRQGHDQAALNLERRLPRTVLDVDDY